MRSLQPRRRGWRRFVYSKFVILLLLCLVVYMGWVVFGMYGRYSSTKTQMMAAAEKTKEVASLKEDLEGKIQSLKTKGGKESVLRKKFMVAGEGEKMVVLVGDGHGTTTQTPKDDTKNESWWAKVTSWF